MSPGYRTGGVSGIPAEVVLRRLRNMGSARGRAGMARFGVRTDDALGIPMAQLRPMARELGRDHRLARNLWASRIHEARILAILIEEPDKVTEAQMDRWARAFNSWDLCDQACLKLFRSTPFAWSKAREWSRRDEEFVKRAGFALMASLAVHAEAPDRRFVALLPLIERQAADPRNFVRKAVSWALRQIGKRNAALRKAAITVARRLAGSEDRSARWVGGDALRELSGR